MARTFRDLWGSSDVRFFSAPGRVNLIGEHTDYNEGFVLPIAVDYSAVIAAGHGSGSRIKAYSLDFAEMEEFDLAAAGRKKSGKWIDYVEGMARVLLEKNYKIGGANLLIGSNVPIGAGLSSSAAIETAVGLALAGLNGNELDRMDLVFAGQQTEHEYAGTKSGIMDQYVAVFGKEGHALLIDCRTLNSKAIRLDLSSAEIVVCNSGIKHALASGEYNTRRSQCEKGVEQLKRHLPEISALRDVTRSDLERYQTELSDLVFRRCRHVVTENERTLDAAKAFETNDLELAGKMMRSSHISLRDDFEVSCPELDLLVSLAEDFDGVYGARMTGGGFGGCTVNLVERERTNEFIEYIARKYERETNRRAEVFIVKPSNGAAEIS